MNGSTKNFYTVLSGLAFGLNWIWEMAQMFAFEIKPEEICLKVFFFCTLASVVDLLVTIGIYDLLRRINFKNQVLFYLLAALLGALCAVGFEWFAFRFGLWSYHEQMIILPILGVGLLPFVQLTILVPLAIWLTRKFKDI